ncbi:MAG: ABC transporter permease [Phycisphaerales bacterium]|nr:ABC transporter permease [Phycisphaerales bacterium]
MRGLPFEYAVRNLGRSPGRLLMSVTGSGLVVLLVLAAGGFVQGMQSAFRASGSPKNVILLGSGSEESVERSEIPMRTTGIAAASLPQIATKAGVEAISPEIHLALPVGLEPTADDEEKTGLAVIRGFTPTAFMVHSETRLITGRMPESGVNEVAVGRLAARSLGFDPSNTLLGQSLYFDDVPFEVVAIIGADGGVIEGEIWMPLTDLQVIAQRDSLSCVVMSLVDEDMSPVEAFTARRIDLEVIAERESSYYNTLSAFFGPIRVMVLVTAILIALGGIIGGLNTTYAAFASRVREVGTLQTLGYSRRAIVRSLVEESVLSACIGGVIACGLGLWLLDGLVVRFSMGVFGITIGPGVLATGLAAALVLGIVGAIVPAIRCLRLPIPEALRSA